jgi:hypothetical protein
MNHYLWWIPTVIATAIFYSWTSVMVNKHPHSFWFWVLCIPIPIWALVARVSNNIAFDGIVFDALLCITYAVGLLWFSGAPGFKPINFCGAGAIVLGIILMKL